MWVLQRRRLILQQDLELVFRVDVNPDKRVGAAASQTPYSSAYTTDRERESTREGRRGVAGELTGRVEGGGRSAEGGGDAVDFTTHFLTSHLGTPSHRASSSFASATAGHRMSLLPSPTEEELVEEEEEEEVFIQCICVVRWHLKMVS